MYTDPKRDAEKFELPIPQPIQDPPLFSVEQALVLTRLFKVFANHTRLRLLHALVRDTELCVSELADVAGMNPQSVSNPLQRLMDHGILGTRRSGTNINYRVVDPCVPLLLELGLCLIECCPEEMCD